MSRRRVPGRNFKFLLANLDLYLICHTDEYSSSGREHGSILNEIGTKKAAAVDTGTPDFWRNRAGSRSSHRTSAVARNRFPLIFLPTFQLLR